MTYDTTRAFAWLARSPRDDRFARFLRTLVPRRLRLALERRAYRSSQMPFEEGAGDLALQGEIVRPIGGKQRVHGVVAQGPSTPSARPVRPLSVGV